MARRNYETLPSDTRRLISGTEGQKIEFKENHNAIDQKDIISFANASGGIILVGIGETEDEITGQQSGRVVGCDVSDRAQRSIIQKAEACIPSIALSITIENRSHRPILRIEIEEGDSKPYSTSTGDYKIRNGASNGMIRPDLMRQMIIESEAETFVRRFKEAGDEIIDSLYEIEDNLLGAIRSVEDVAQEATDATNAATEAAESPRD